MDELQNAVLSDEKVGGLDVPMEEAARVDESQGTGRLDQVVEGERLVRTRQRLREGFPFDILHGEEGSTRRGIPADVEDVDEVGMAQAGEEGELVAGEERRVLAARVEDFQRDSRGPVGVESPMDR